jgi:hypothetical protein
MHRLCNFALRLGNLAAASSRLSALLVFSCQTQGGCHDRTHLERRSLCGGIAALGVAHLIPSTEALAQAAAPKGYVLGANEGEHLVHFRNPCNIFINV